MKTLLRPSNPSVKNIARTSCERGSCYDTIPQLQGKPNWQQWSDALHHAAILNGTDGVLRGESLRPRFSDPQTHLPNQYNDTILRLAIWEQRNKILLEAMKKTLSPHLKFDKISANTSAANKLFIKLEAKYASKRSSKLCPDTRKQGNTAQTKSEPSKKKKKKKQKVSKVKSAVRKEDSASCNVHKTKKQKKNNPHTNENCPTQNPCLRPKDWQPTLQERRYLARHPEIENNQARKGRSTGSSGDGEKAVEHQASLDPPADESREGDDLQDKIVLKRVSVSEDRYSLKDRGADMVEISDQDSDENSDGDTDDEISEGGVALYSETDDTDDE